MSERDAYQEKMEAQLREWTAKIDGLQAKADQAKAEAKITYHEQVKALRGKQAALQQKLQEMTETGEKAWEDLRGGVEKAWSDMKRAVEDAAAKMR